MLSVSPWSLERRDAGPVSAIPVPPVGDWRALEPTVRRIVTPEKSLSVGLTQVSFAVMLR